MQGEHLAGTFSVLTTAKHYAGDSGAGWGTSTMYFPAIPSTGVPVATHFMIDQGDALLDEAKLRARHLAPHFEAVQAGAQTVMASLSCWNGEKLHAHHYLLTEVLKGEMGFTGYVDGDWASINQISDDIYQATVARINAGIDISMVPFDYQRFVADMHRAVESVDIRLDRVDNAVSRILTVKMRAGLFESPDADDSHLHLVGCQEHRTLTRQTVARSAVLFKNKDHLLPLKRDYSRILVAGKWADNIGYQCGGWTIEWLGGSGKITPGTTILEAIRATLSPETIFEYDPNGLFKITNDGGGELADVGLTFIGETPYAEGFGDRAGLSLDREAVSLLERMRSQCQKMAVVLVTGRPLIITDQLPLMDGLVVTWLPGSEGQGVADVLFGDVPFGGILPYTWPKDMGQIPLSNIAKSKPLSPFGFGLS